MLYMEIGGVQFIISSQTPGLLQKHEEVYLPFIKSKKSSKVDIDIYIRLEAGDVPGSDTFEKIFDSGQSWSMFRDGEHYRIVRWPPAFNRPLWTAHFNRDMADVRVYCGDKITSTPFRYPLDQILLMYILAKNRGAIFHAAGMRIAAKGFIFPGTSGAGKSTLSRLFAGCKKTEISRLSDDRMIIRKIDGAFRAFGTPWPGEEGIARNESMPVSAIFFLKHDKKNNLKKLKSSEVLEKLVRVTSIPWYDRDVMDKLLQFCEEVIAEIPCFDLHFKPGPGVVQFLANPEI